MPDMRRIRRHIDLDSATLLATTLVSIHLGYCKSLLYGIADTDLNKASMCSELTSPRWVTKSPPFHSQCSTASFLSLVASKV